MTRCAEEDPSLVREISRELTSYSTPLTFHHGTGLSIYKNLLLPAILNARHEVILTTCFWAASATLDELVSTLKQLSSKSITAQHGDAARIKIYICFSSRSAAQKILHTSSHDGFIYPSDEWPGKLGLPSPEELPGLDITVKSLFFRPFSVLHSKYLIVDRQKVFLPSCNVSWEDWYECAVGLEGPIVHHVFNFWREVWRPLELEDLSDERWNLDSAEPIITPTRNSGLPSKLSLRCTLLPHPHNSSLRQSLWFVPSGVAPLPGTPLNQTLINLIIKAKEEVILLTPNFTSQSAFTAVCSALLSGVYVHLITNRRMMVPEQLATAGAVTEQFVDRLVKEFQRNFSGRKIRKSLTKLKAFLGQSPPSKPVGSRKLRISYFHQPKQVTAGPQITTSDQPSSAEESTRFGIASHATKSHVKLTLVDRKSIVLGSGNMDRASWRTSQELDVLIEHDTETGNPSSIVENMWKEVEKGLEGCLETYFDG